MTEQAVPRTEVDEGPMDRAWTLVADIRRRHKPIPEGIWFWRDLKNFAFSDRKIANGHAEKMTAYRLRHTPPVSTPTDKEMI